MSITGSADYFRFKGAFEGCISGHDSNFSHRPYHKNCRCALHDKSRRLPADLSPSFPPNCNSVSFSVRRSRSHGSLSLAVSGHSTARFAGLRSSSVADLAASLPEEVTEFEHWEEGEFVSL